jgi:16S rRNA (guanine966-N2)-methyltransferase
MRVIAGIARGRTLKGPPARRRGGPAVTGTRPSSDLVRGALFNALSAVATDFTRVLDLYAGTGALGIEALSRGAEWCDFVEKDRAMAEIIRENLRTTAFDDHAGVYPISAERAPQRLTNAPYTLVLADPPYADPASSAALKAIANSELVSAENTTIVLEHSGRDEPLGNLGPFRLAKVLRHGDSAVSIYLPDDDSDRQGR